MSNKFMNDSDIRRFKLLMRKSGFASVVKLAEAMGVKSQTLYRKVNGQGDWSRNEMELVGRLFREDPKNIFFGQ